MNTNAINKCAVMDCDTGKITEGLPMFLQEGGEEKVAERRKELEVFVKLLKTAPSAIIPKTMIFLNPKNSDYDAWWGHQDTKRSVSGWLLNNDHEVNGKFGNWSAGFLGSRWADCEINGKKCRFAFYSRKTDPHNFPAETRRPDWDGKNYILSINPSN